VGEYEMERYIFGREGERKRGGGIVEYRRRAKN
jgi:hypothetical protein